MIFCFLFLSLHQIVSQTVAGDSLSFGPKNFQKGCNNGPKD